MKLFFLILAIASGAWAQSAGPYLPVTKILRAKGYQIGVYSDSFSTTKTVDEEGKKEELPEGTSFTRYQSEIMGQYGATNDLQFGLGLRFRQNSLKVDESGTDVSASSSGIQSTFFNFVFAFEQVDQIQYAVEGIFRYSPYTNDEIADADPKVLILGDAGNEMSAGLAATFQSRGNNFLAVRAGYRRPGSELSHELYWQAEGAVAWKYIALVAGVDGVTSLKNDPYESHPEDRPIYNAGTKLYGSINREWVAPYAGLNLALGDTWRIELKGSSVVSGNSTDLGTAFGFNLIRRVDKSLTRMVDSKFKSYDIETSITKVSPKKEYVVVDKGLADDLFKGMRIDFFEFDYVGGNILVATGIVMKLKSDTAIVKITQRYNMKKEIKEGLIGRAALK